MCPKTHKDIFCNFVVRLEQNADEIFERPLKQTQYSDLPICQDTIRNSSCRMEKDQTHKIISRAASPFLKNQSSEFSTLLEGLKGLPNTNRMRGILDRNVPTSSRKRLPPAPESNTPAAKKTRMARHRLAS